jgi:hypothetical protein
VLEKGCSVSASDAPLPEAAGMLAEPAANSLAFAPAAARVDARIAVAAVAAFSAVLAVALFAAKRISAAAAPGGTTLLEATARLEEASS